MASPKNPRTGNGSAQIYAEVLAVYDDNRLKIHRALFPNQPVPDNESYETRPISLKNYGSPGSTFVKLDILPQGSQEPRHQLIAKHYGSKKRDTKFEPYDVADVAYGFLRNNANLKNVPRCYHPQETRILFLDWIPGSTHRQVLKSLNHNSKIQEIYRLFGPLNDFYCNSTQAQETLPPHGQVKKTLFNTRKLVDRARDYLEITTRSAEDNEIKAYNELIGKGMQGKVVAHGDLSHENIIIREGDNSVHFIDPRLCFSDPVFELGSLIAYNNIDEDFSWNEKDDLALEFKKRFLKRFLSNGGLRDIQFVFDEEAKTDALFRFYTGFVHSSWRNLSHNQSSRRYNENEENRLRKNLVDTLGKLVDEQERFGLTNEELSDTRILLSKAQEIKDGNSAELERKGISSLVAALTF